MRIFRIALIAVIMSVNFTSCDGSKRNYKVAFDEGAIYITMKCPSIGVAGWREVHFDGFTPTEIEEEVFDGIRKREYSGDYNVYITLQFLDSHGNYYDSQEKVKVSTLKGEDVKKYADFGYFKGKVSIDKSYPWNYNYHNK